MPTTIMSEIRLKWMRENIPIEYCKDLSEIVIDYKKYLEELGSKTPKLNVDFPIEKEIKYARDKITTMAHYHYDEFNVKPAGVMVERKRVCISQYPKKS